MALYSVDAPYSFACDFIAVEIIESEQAFHDDKFWKFHVPWERTSDAKGDLWLNEKKKESRNLNPGLTAWVISLSYGIREQMQIL